MPTSRESCLPIKKDCLHSNLGDNHYYLFLKSYFKNFKKNNGKQLLMKCLYALYTKYFHKYVILQMNFFPELLSFGKEEKNNTELKSETPQLLLVLFFIFSIQLMSSVCQMLNLEGCIRLF